MHEPRNEPGTGPGQPARYKTAILWAGDATTRRTAKLEETRLARVADALRQSGVMAEAAVYADEWVDEVRDQLLGVDGVLVWVNPIVMDGDRSVLDGLLRDVADAGVLVSAHPDVILKMGTKDVLFSTRQMTWGCDTRFYPTLNALRDELPRCLAEGGPRVLKHYRGNGGTGVLKVERVSDARVRVRHAQRGSVEEDVRLDEFLTRCESYFAGGGGMIDHPYQERLPDGMIRSYLVRDKVAGRAVDQCAAPRARRCQTGRSTGARTATLLSTHPSGLPAAEGEVGNGVGAGAVSPPGNRRRFTPGNLGCGLSLRPEDPDRRGHVRALRNQCELGVSVPR